MASPGLYRQRDSADQLRQEYASRVDRVRQNRDLSDEGRQRQLADIYVETKGKLNKLATAEQEHLSVRKTSLEKELFGAKGARAGQDPGTHAISARDASERAAQISSPQEAAELLRRAESDGDEILARAVARRSSENSYTSLGQQSHAWDDVTRIYLNARPSLVPVVEELAEIERLTTRPVFSSFSVPEPAGVAPQYINQARSGITPEPAERLSTRPLLDPRTTTTTHQQRADWAAATGAPA